MPDKRRRALPDFSGYTFTGFDFLLLLPLLALLAVVIVRLLVLPPDGGASTPASARFRLTQVSEGAQGRLSPGDVLYTEDGVEVGEVTAVTYTRPGGNEWRAYFELQVEGEICPGGLRLSSDEGEGLLLTVGRDYPLHAQNLALPARCVALGEEPASAR